MKKKRLTKKLILNKETISSLGKGEMDSVKGGIILDTQMGFTCLVGDCWTMVDYPACPWTYVFPCTLPI